MERVALCAVWTIMQDGGKPGVDEKGERRVFDEVSDEVVSDLWTCVYED